MAAVIRARDTQLDRLVALKILTAGHGRRSGKRPPLPPGGPQRPPASTTRTSPASSSVARTSGCTSSLRVRRGRTTCAPSGAARPLPVAEALHYILQVAAGLAHAAQRGVVHRDIKRPTSSSPTGRAKLVDMGLARSLERQDDQHSPVRRHRSAPSTTSRPSSFGAAARPTCAATSTRLGCTPLHVLTGHPPVRKAPPPRKLHHTSTSSRASPRELGPRPAGRSPSSSTA